MKGTKGPSHISSVIRDHLLLFLLDLSSLGASTVLFMFERLFCEFEERKSALYLLFWQDCLFHKIKNG